MKQLCIYIIVLFFIVTALGADPVEEEPLNPLHAEIMSQGGSYTAIANGYNSLFTNPAGFSQETDGNMSLLATNIWIHSRPDQLLASIQGLSGGGSEEDIASILAEQFTGNGFGIGGSTGIAFVGGNVGLGLTFTMDSFFSGKTFPLGQSGYMLSEISLIGGYALPLDLGPLRLSIGGDVRPFVRVHSQIDDATDLIASVLGVDTGSDPSDNYLNNIDALNGFGIAFDAGLLAEIGPFTAGLSARDITGTNISYAQHSLQAVLDTLPQFGLPDTSDPSYQPVEQQYVIPMSFTTGLAFHPDLGGFSNFIDPMVHAQLDDPFLLLSGEINASIWTKLHLGAQVELFNFWKLWGGLNQGYVTLGTGMHLLFLDLKAGVFTRELGRYPGDKPSSGLAVELAIRF